jgi:hypothetical protein
MGLSKILGGRGRWLVPLAVSWLSLGGGSPGGAGHRIPGVGRQTGRVGGAIDFAIIARPCLSFKKA